MSRPTGAVSFDTDGEEDRVPRLARFSPKQTVGDGARTSLTLNVGSRAADAEAADEEKEGRPRHGRVSPSQQDTLSMALVIAQMQQQLQQQQQTQQRIVQELAQINQSRAREQFAPARSPATPAVSASPGPTHYSASASLPIPPIVGQPRRQSLRRQSHLVQAAQTPLPTQAARAAPQEDGDFLPEYDTLLHDEQEASHEQQQARSARPDVHDAQWRSCNAAVAKIMKPFYGQASRDADNVIDWVENIDTQFSIRLQDRQDGRLDLVRSMLAGTALKWMNREVAKMNAQLQRGELSAPIEWDVLRKPFIDAHLGVNTVETFKAQLRALHLGSKQTPSPVEFDKEFDHLAELAYPDRTGEAMDQVLGDEYATIIRNSNRPLWRKLVERVDSNDLSEWRKRLAWMWSVQKTLDLQDAQDARAAARSSTAKPQGQADGNRPAWFNRNRTTATVNALGSEGMLSGEGLPDRAEGETALDDVQLVAANGGGEGRLRGRGGRSGGGSGERKQWDAERTRLYEEKKCFRCGETGHQVKQCKKPADFKRGNV